MQKHLGLFVYCFFLYAAIAPAQEPVSSIAPRRYATQIRLRQLQEMPGVPAAMAAAEQFTAAYLPTGVQDTVVVALVLHLLPLPDGTQKISIDDLAAQIERLNTDFSSPSHPYLAGSYQQPAQVFDSEGNLVGTEADLQPYLHQADREEGFARRAALPLVRFCLAAYDPNGQPTTGILQPIGTGRLWATGDAICQSSAGGSDAWNPARYCNIWVARLGDGHAGYAQMPGGPAETDGIVLDDRFFAKAAPDTANPYTLGRSLVHLMGSYLNLYELWNEFQPCADDYVEDTPIHNAPNHAVNPYKHISTCSPDHPCEMTMNLMDNTVDRGQYLFTHGQVLRMRATLAEGGPRGALRSTPSDCGASSPTEPRLALKETPKNTAALSARILPNPSSGPFTIEILYDRSADVQLLLLDSRGITVHRQLVAVAAGTITHCQIPATHWASGMYTLSLQTGDQRLTQKVLIER